ncbi:MAG: site-specific DNA-methyltransferase [Chloroflexota bacterium]|nr:site-specific DNA-methyltransferase [Chloroflexota bacterium]
MKTKLAINEIYDLDCFEFLAQVDDKIVDLAVIDPPYNMKKAEWDTFESEASFFEFTYSWIDSLIPKIKPDGSLYIFNTPYNSAFILQHLVSRGLFFQNWITWDKRDGMGGARRRFSNGQETILFFTKSRHHTFNFDEIRVPYESTQRIKHAKTKGILKNGKRWYPNSNGRLCGEVWHFSSARHKNKVNGKVRSLGHETPKPIDMIERVIRASSNEGDLVLDCFAGTGTTAVAAQRLRRNFICGDQSAEYVNMARQRLLSQMQES